MKATPLQHREQSPSRLPGQTIPAAQAAAPRGATNRSHQHVATLGSLLLRALATSAPAFSFLYWPINTLLAHLQVTSAASKSPRTVKMPKSSPQEAQGSRREPVGGRVGQQELGRNRSELQSSGVAKQSVQLLNSAQEAAQGRG